MLNNITTTKDKTTKLKKTDQNVVLFFMKKAKIKLEILIHYEKK